MVRGGVGGIRGREALDRLRNVVGRVESSWRPATAEEGFEIVRRRLFEPIPGDMFKQRDLTARAFADLYQAQAAEFPPDLWTRGFIMLGFCLVFVVFAQRVFTRLEDRFPERL